MIHPDSPWRWTWSGSLSCFLLAIATGALFRFGMLTGLPFGLQAGNVRHAHSHLMFLGWVTPLLMGLIVAWLPRVSGRPLRHVRGFRFVISSTLLLALLAYLPFLLFGYQVAAVGSLRLPLASLCLGLSMLSWYGFMGLYWRATRGQPRPLPVRLWDAALFFLGLASIGAWGVALLARLQVENPFWSLASTQLFLDTFTQGWFVLALLGIFYASVPQVRERPFLQQPLFRAASNGLLLGLPLHFLLTLPPGVVPTLPRAIASVGGWLIALGLAAHLSALWPVLPRLYRLPLPFLALNLLSTLLLTFPAGAQWFGRSALRVSYLHWLLLGFVTLSLVLLARHSWPIPLSQRSITLFSLALVGLLLTLIPLTGLWPRGWNGRWIFHLAAWGTLPPLLISAGWWLSGWRTLRRTPTQPTTAHKTA